MLIFVIKFIIPVDLHKNKLYHHLYWASPFTLRALPSCDHFQPVHLRHFQSFFVHTSIKVELVWASPPAPASLSHSPSLLVLTQRRPEGKCSRYPSPSWLPLLLPMLVLVPAPPDPLLSLNPAAGILLNKAEHGKSGIGWNEYNPATPLYGMSQRKWDFLVNHLPTYILNTLY